jgi:hypothetical protein
MLILSMVNLAIIAASAARPLYFGKSAESWNVKRRSTRA